MKEGGVSLQSPILGGTLLTPNPRLSTRPWLGGGRSWNTAVDVIALRFIRFGGRVLRTLLLFLTTRIGILARWLKPDVNLNIIDYREVWVGSQSNHRSGPQRRQGAERHSEQESSTYCIINCLRMLKMISTPSVYHLGLAHDRTSGWGVGNLVAMS